MAFIRYLAFTVNSLNSERSINLGNIKFEKIWERQNAIHGVMRCPGFLSSGSLFCCINYSSIQRNLILRNNLSVKIPCYGTFTTKCRQGARELTGGQVALPGLTRLCCCVAERTLLCMWLGHGRKNLPFDAI